MIDNNAHNEPPESDEPDSEEEELFENEEEEELEEEEEATRFQDMVKKSRPLPSTTTKSGELFLVRGKDRGEPAWHYVFVKRAKLPLFREAVKGGSLDVADYGEVVKSGWGKNPPDEVIEEMKEKYT